MNDKFITRRALRWGSEKTGEFATLEEAKAFALKDIKKHGNIGKIEDVIENVVYYDVYEEEQ